MEKLKVGYAVVSLNGQIGMIYRLYEVESDPNPGRALVQFGASGPFKVYRQTSLRFATLKEVEGAGMYGTGFNTIDEE